jgi:iron complex outermembrane receptor protein
MPTLLELYGNAGTVTGNGGLVPEEGINRDIGVVLASKNFGILREPSLEVVYLDNKIDNLILFFPNSQYTARPDNIGSARVTGIELALSTFVTRRLRVTGNYAYLDTKDTSPIPYYNGNRLPARPLNDTALFVDVIERWWSLSYEYHHIGSNFLKRANLKEVPARELHNIALRLKPFTDTVTLTVEGQNLTDNRVSDVAGFPLPGRAVYATAGFTY